MKTVESIIQSWKMFDSSYTKGDPCLWTQTCKIGHLFSINICFTTFPPRYFPQFAQTHFWFEAYKRKVTFYFKSKMYELCSNQAAKTLIYVSELTIFCKKYCKKNYRVSKVLQNSDEMWIDKRPSFLNTHWLLWISRNSSRYNSGSIMLLRLISLKLNIIYYLLIRTLVYL